MSIVQRATKRLEELKRAGIAVPDLAESLFQDGAGRHAGFPPDSAAPTDPAPALAVSWLSAEQEDMGQGPHTPKRGSVIVGAPESVTLDLDRLERLGFIVPTSTRTIQAEEFRHVKRPLLQNARDRESGNSRLAQIMVTSALPGEGKTYFSINLAMSMAAEIDTAVLLIDADVLHPTVLHRLGIAERRGLLDLLTDPELDLADVVLATSVPKLSILPSGTRNDRSTELLASNAMEEFLANLTDRYRDHVIIFDAPPLLLTNEAKVLASRIGQVVLVVEASKTPQSVVAEAFAALEQCPIVSSVLNKARKPLAPLGYGYYQR